MSGVRPNAVDRKDGAGYPGDPIGPRTFARRWYGGAGPDPPSGSAIKPVALALGSDSGPGAGSSRVRGPGKLPPDMVCAYVEGDIAFAVRLFPATGVGLRGHRAGIGRSATGSRKSRVGPPTDIRWPCGRGSSAWPSVLDGGRIGRRAKAIVPHRGSFPDCRDLLPDARTVRAAARGLAKVGCWRRFPPSWSGVRSGSWRAELSARDVGRIPVSAPQRVTSGIVRHGERGGGSVVPVHGGDRYAGRSNNASDAPDGDAKKGSRLPEAPRRPTPTRRNRVPPPKAPRAPSAP